MPIRGSGTSVSSVVTAGPGAAGAEESTCGSGTPAGGVQHAHPATGDRMNVIIGIEARAAENMCVDFTALLR
jgi:hypothetical protein